MHDDICVSPDIYSSAQSSQLPDYSYTALALTVILALSQSSPIDISPSASLLPCCFSLCHQIDLCCIFAFILVIIRITNSAVVLALDAVDRRIST